MEGRDALRPGRIGEGVGGETSQLANPPHENVSVQPQFPCGLGPSVSLRSDSVVAANLHREAQSTFVDVIGGAEAMS